MQQLELTGGRRQAMQQMALVLALLALTISGIHARATFAPTAVARPALAAPLPQASVPGRAIGGGGDRALAQSRAFYAEQMASEEALDSWALPAAPAPDVSPEPGAFYVAQMASEAALERWTGRAQLPDRAESLRLKPLMGEGLSFE